MDSIRNFLFIKYLWIFLSLLIFNYSIDVPDIYSDEIAEDLSFNDIESISELVLEVVFECKNAVPEHDEDDQDEKSGFTKKIDAPILQNIVLEKKPFVFIILTKHVFKNIQKFINKPYLSNLIKPPQA